RPRIRSVPHDHHATVRAPGPPLPALAVARSPYPSPGRARGHRRLRVLRALPVLPVPSARRRGVNEPFLLRVHRLRAAPQRPNDARAETTPPRARESTWSPGSEVHPEGDRGAGAPAAADGVRSPHDPLR